MATSWNLADIWETVADVRPDQLAQACGGREFTWRDFDRRSNALAADLLEAGLGHQSKVAAYLHNGPEYLETYFAAFKAALVPVNVNYRYGPEEVTYLLDNADAEAVFFDAEFAPVLEQILDRLPQVRRWYCVVDPAQVEAGASLQTPSWAVDYEDVISAHAGTARVLPPEGRSPDDILLLYTGGTTGMPKGVMWRQDDLVNVLGGGGNLLVGTPPAADIGEIRTRLEGGQAGLVSMPACPLMHGTGQFSAFISLIGGGAVVTMPERRFDPAALWEAVSARGVNAVAIVGDAFARPMLAALEANPGRYDLSKLILINSSGVMWSQEVKSGLLRHAAHLILFDSLGSSEAVGLGASISASGASSGTAHFNLGAGARVVGPDDKDVTPGSGEVGMIALPGFIPLGYYKDQEKTAKTFRVIDGTRYTIPGDCATVDADGTIQLLGRGSVVINTGGEKVYPEEVEEVIKQLPAVADAVCVGAPDERFGEKVCAVVQLQPGAQLGAGEVTEAVRARLAGYKVPRMVKFVESIGRSPAGKVDYQYLKKVAAEPAI